MRNIFDIARGDHTIESRISRASKPPRFTLVSLIIGLIFLVRMTCLLVILYLIVQLAIEIKSTGLKPMIERIWEGPAAGAER